MWRNSKADVHDQVWSSYRKPRYKLSRDYHCTVVMTIMIVYMSMLDLFLYCIYCIVCIGTYIVQVYLCL